MTRARACATSRPGWASPSAPLTASSPTWPSRRCGQGQGRAPQPLPGPGAPAAARPHRPGTHRWRSPGPARGARPARHRNGPCPADRQTFVLPRAAGGLAAVAAGPRSAGWASSSHNTARERYPTITGTCQDRPWSTATCWSAGRSAIRTQPPGETSYQVATNRAPPSVTMRRAAPGPAEAPSGGISRMQITSVAAGRGWPGSPRPAGSKDYPSYLIR